MPRLITQKILQTIWDCFLTKLLIFIEVSVFIFTMPWECLRMPINHILQMQPGGLQTQQIQTWCRNKKGEYRYVAMSGAVVASAVTASFSWNALYVNANATWLTLGTWYGSIIFSLMSVMVAFLHIILFTDFDTDPEGPRRILRAISKDNQKPDIIFLFALQVPVMLLSISLMSYLTGLSLLVIIPLWKDECRWGMGMKTAAVYLGYLIFGVFNYLFVCLVFYIKCRPVAVHDNRGSP